MIRKLIRRVLDRIFYLFFRFYTRSGFPLAWDWSEVAKIVKYMSESGNGTDQCLKIGCLPMKVHFYSPVPDISDLEARKIWDRKSEMAGIDFRPAKQLTFIKELGANFGDECDWPLNPTEDPTQFYLLNGCFSYGCAAPLHTIIRNFKPKHLIEIGSGNSSRVISKALQQNNTDIPANPCDYTIIDPYPGEVVTSKLTNITNLIKERAECVDIQQFDILEANDILFIDSSHTVRTGSDVNFLFLDVLPRLKSGVIIHMHDISLPYEYEKVYFTNPSFRVFWTEAYLLQAFLAFNREFETLLAMNYLQTNHMDEFCKAFHHFRLEDNWSISGSYWIRRRP